MKKAALLVMVFALVVFSGCNKTQTGTEQAPDRKPAASTVSLELSAAQGEAKILQSWQGDFPVAQLDLLPENQREQGIGFIGDAETFAGVWQAFKPDEDVPQIDFEANLALFARNTQFYNSISIGKVNLKDGVAEALAMETRSAMPIEDNVAMSMVMVAREGITAIQTGNGAILTGK
jgi:hypothetical protein